MSGLSPNLSRETKFSGARIETGKKFSLFSWPLLISGLATIPVDAYSAESYCHTYIMNAAAELWRNLVSKHQIQPSGYGDEQADAGRDCQTCRARPNA